MVAGSALPAGGKIATRERPFENDYETMKIRGVSAEFTTSEVSAFEIEAIIPPDVAKAFTSLYAEQSDNGGISLSVEGNIIRLSQNPLPIGFADFLETLLSQAEGVVAHSIEAKTDRQALDVTVNSEAAEQLSRVQGRPIV